MKFVKKIVIYLKIIILKIVDILLKIKYKLIYKFGDKEKLILIDGQPDSRRFKNALNFPLAEYLSNKRLIPSKFISSKILKSQDHYAVIGSVIQWCKPTSSIWGPGLIGEHFNHSIPAKLFAVRGLKTREKLLERCESCPEIYGDPALLLPIIYNPKIYKKYRYGIIQHYVDKNTQWINTCKGNKDILII